jgi:hypothetical protein
MESENFTYFHNIFNHNKNIYLRRLGGTQGKDHLPSASGPSILQRDDCPRTTQADGRFPSQPCRQMPGRGVSYTREPNSPPRLRLIPPSSSRLPRRPHPESEKSEPHAAALGFPRPPRIRHRQRRWRRRSGGRSIWRRDGPSCRRASPSSRTSSRASPSRSSAPRIT